MMDIEIRSEWVRRLRSGDYLQGTNFLKRYVNDAERPEHCCLGVLCEIAAERDVVQMFDFEYDRHVTYFGDNAEMLPESVARWAGLPHDDEPSVWEVRVDPEKLTGTANVGYATLAEANDNGVSFDRIADYIEAYL